MGSPVRAACFEYEYVHNRVVIFRRFRQFMDGAEVDFVV